MDIRPASSYDLDAFSSAGAYAGDVGPGEPVDDPIEVRTSSEPDAPGQQDQLLEEAQSGVASLEGRFTAFTQLLRRELTTLENRCAAALRSLFSPGGASAGSAGVGSAGAGSASVGTADATLDAAAQRADGRAMESGASRFSGVVDSAARRNRLDPALLDAVIAQESGFRPDAVSSAGAVGLMQLMPDTARELGVSDPFDAGQNVEGGAKYLRSLLDRYNGRLDLALAAYNAGPGAVDRFGGIPPYAETQRYVASIMAGYRSAVLHAG